MCAKASSVKVPAKVPFYLPEMWHYDYVKVMKKVTNAGDRFGNFWTMEAFMADFPEPDKVYKDGLIVLYRDSKGFRKLPETIPEAFRSDLMKQETLTKEEKASMEEDLRAEGITFQEFMDEVSSSPHGLREFISWYAKALSRLSL